MASTAMFPYVNEKPFDDIRNLENHRNSDHQSNYTVNTDRANTRKPRKVVFYKNGDKYFNGKLVAITPNKYFSFRELMNDLNRSVDLPYGVRRVYTPVNGREIYDIDELEDGSSYVCASFEPFRPTKYGDTSEKPWNGKIVHPSHRQEINGSNVPQQALPSIHASYPNNNTQNSTQNQSNYYLPRHYLKNLPLVANHQNGFTVNNSQSMKRSNNNVNAINSVYNSNIPVALAPITNKPNNSNSNNNNNNNAQTANNAAVAAANNEAWSKPRLITIVRATEKPRKKISILLNRKGLHSYEQFVCDISDAFGLPQWKNDKIRKLYTIRGKRVQGISDFFRDDDMFVGCGKESLTPKLIQDLLDEVYQDNPDYAQHIFNEWESSRSRATKPRYSSLEQNLNNSLGNGSLSTHRDLNGADTSPENNPNNTNNRKNHFNIEFDENGKRKRKKKIAESDILLEMEAQRQRERIKLIEIERKKRDLASNVNLSKVSDTNTNNSNNNNNNQIKTLPNVKRVNIKTPTNKSNEQQNVDLLPPLDAKKLKRKPKFKKYMVDENIMDIAASTKNPTPSSVSGIILEEHQPPPSRNLKSKSPAKELLESNINLNSNEPVKNSTNHTNNTNAAVVSSSSHQTVAEPVNNKVEAHHHQQPHHPEPVKPLPKPEITEKPKKAISKKDEISSNKLKRQISNASHVSEKYDFIKTLGDGNFAIVKQARHKVTDHEYAIKIIDKSKMKGKENMIENEIYIMKSCNHPNIVKLYEEFETKDEVYLVTDLVKGGDLFDAITQSVKFNEKDSACMVQDLCEALFYLHSKNIVHRDLKPENLLVMRRKDDKISIKLADFGLAMEVKHPIFTVCGTPTYVAPEILSEIGYGLEVDMWACGVITYILLCGFPPFRSLDRNQDELFQYIQAGEFEYLMPYWDGISDTSKDLINHLLVVDIKKRWKAEDVLCHPWIVTHGNSKPMPTNYDEHKREQLNELRTKAKQYAAEPFVTS